MTPEIYIVLAIAFVLWIIALIYRTRREIISQNAHLTLEAKIICPHCHTRSHVHTQPITRKLGISGGKMAAAIVTGGLSIFIAGLSRVGKATHAHCTNCGSTWTIS